jgi:UDP-N-acetylmuramoyl-L-alanyl-D-glutamate--2,6-diaminopimelate ligase
MTQNAKSLAELGLTALGGPMRAVTGLAIDSRKVGPGTLFAALPGTQVHGARFVAGAIADGAVAILTDREGAEIAAEALSGSNVALIVAEDARATLAHAAALWFGPGPRPSSPSPAPTARPPSRASPARSGNGWATGR